MALHGIGKASVTADREAAVRLPLARAGQALVLQGKATMVVKVTVLRLLVTLLAAAAVLAQ